MKPVFLLPGAAHLLAASTPAPRVPATANGPFAAPLATASAAKWENAGTDSRVGGTLAGRELSAGSTAGGKLKASETALTGTQLPAAVQTPLTCADKPARVIRATRIRRAGGSPVYEAETKQGGKKQSGLFTTEGKPTN